MGGHGGLNILPQKRWNVYNYDNREKVRLDEEAAAKEEQLKREQARKRDAEFRLEQLRTARSLAPTTESVKPDEPESKSGVHKPLRLEDSSSDSGHINLFEGINIFDPVKGSKNEGSSERDGFKRKKMKKEEAVPKVVTAEDEKYRLGYGVAGKGIKLPWYLERPRDGGDAENDEYDSSSRGIKERKSSGKKTLEQLREERLNREKREKERERALMMEKRQKQRAEIKDRGYSRRD